MLIVSGDLHGFIKVLSYFKTLLVRNSVSLVVRVFTKGTSLMLFYKGVWMYELLGNSEIWRG